ncbi:hypothetical protein T05_14337 [Trichinella murrelli]|uniref:Uncharacterized protein n=1 Tax=Trichinella murrelli TaxID=144512 RepID=A0A0V0UGG0_9BILA|nr:hypothetical protein T05_14337 [Trichinella murrelli]
MANKQLRKMIICEIFSNAISSTSVIVFVRATLVAFDYNVQDDTAQYLERAWFDYCSLHVSTVISHSALWFSTSSK